jgi:hypothetical protein
MGGAVVVAASKALLKEKKYTIIGICMLDVAGGTIISAARCISQSAENLYVARYRDSSASANAKLSR